MTPPRPKKALQRKRPMNRVSKKNWWHKLRPKLVKAFNEAGIRRCELGYTGCSGYIFTGFAHSLKRRFIATDEEKAQVVLACCSCHRFIEILPHPKMMQVVIEAINAREVQPIIK